MLDKDIELLAPVGSMEALYAAVQNGADAVYLGGKLFSARQYANNFDLKELKLAVDYAHIRGVKVYVTVNILIDDQEMEKSLSYIEYLYEIDVDGLILQDLGLIYLIRKVFPDFELHGSTQMTINNLPGAVFLEKLGLKRVVLAREVPLKEISEIYDSANIELEGFIHGALCVSYSGQCLMSSIIGGRSGNRGRCAQPCRMPYNIIDYNNGKVVFDKWSSQHILSPKDLNTIDYIEDIVGSGIVSLKIEGRMKRPEYVATIVKNYRNALDFGPGKISDMDQRDILQIFNRGFTKGLMLGDFGRSFVSSERPDNRGILVGKVIDLDNQNIFIKLNEDVEENDGLEFETTSGEYKGIVLSFSGKKGQTIKVDHIFGIYKNSKVYKTSSSQLLKEAKESFSDENIKHPIELEMKVTIGKSALLVIRYGGLTIEVRSNAMVERAKKLPLTEEKIIEQLSKLNDTVYYIDNIDIDLEDGAFMSLSEINGLRRDGVKKLNDIRKNFNNRNPINEKEYKNRLKQYFRYENNKIRNKKDISVIVNKKEQFEQLNIDKLDRLYIGFYDELKEIIPAVKAKDKEVYLRTEKILFKDDLNELKEILNPIIHLLDGVSVSNIGTFQYIKDNFNINIHGDIGLNVFNSFTVKLLKDCGINSLTVSPELNINQIENICNAGSSIYESIGYGYLPLMITEHCPMSLVKNCKDDSKCKSCLYREGFGLRDRKNIDFYMERKSGTTTIYNSYPLMVLDSLDKIYDAGIDMVRLDFTFEKDGIKDIQDIYYDYAKGIASKSEANEFLQEYRKENNITRGHYFRGVI